MRKLLLAIGAATLFACAPAHAEEYEQQSDREYCAEIEMLSAEIMRARQEGVGARSIMELVGDNLIYQAIVRDAYNQPRYNTPSMQRQEVQDFADAVYMLCLREQDNG